MSVIRIAAIAATMIVAAPVHAAEFQPFTPQAFEAAKAAGRPVLVDVHAWWCPVCGSQARTIKAETAKPEYAKLIVFRINYDNQKAEWQKLGVRKQATIIAYHGTRETGRIQFMTDKVKIADLIASTNR